jgi:hypothetical protein
MPATNINRFSAIEMAQHIIVWHLVADGSVEGLGLARSFDRQRQLIARWNLHAHQHLAILATMARSARPQPARRSALLTE